MSDPIEPTADQCTNNSPCVLDDGRTGYAIWYPQMGGYVAKAIIVGDDCFEAWVWHDGDFPFSTDRHGNDDNPRHLHHCDPAKFIDFGQAVIRILNIHVDRMP